MFQRPAPAENARKFQQITQIPSNSPTQSANHAKFTPFVNLLDIMFQAPARQRTLRNSSKLCRFHAVRPHSLRTTRNSPNLLTYYILCFRCLTSGRELPKIPANQAKFAHFAHISCKLHEFHAFHSKLIHI